ncbi:MAG: hypothetical protein EZS28_022446 [Streblomastix strix]|uniref:Uncharacterized protein n=1 Tax=Streblomastix strix TaxID=222440 RepID=A0A5J4VHU1_9EUKA|nr:MAG: hypothetical protein EZS28_022446 [Streblomastix strix]
MQVKTYLMKNSLISARILDVNLIQNICQRLLKSRVAGADEYGTIICLFDRRSRIRGSKSGSGIQTTSGSCVGGLEETKAELLCGSEKGFDASIDELLTRKQQGKGSSDLSHPFKLKFCIPSL